MIGIVVVILVLAAMFCGAVLIAAEHEIEKMSRRSSAADVETLAEARGEDEEKRIKKRWPE